MHGRRRTPWKNNSPPTGRRKGSTAEAATYSDLAQINTGATTVTPLAPGVYCGGVNIKQGIVQLTTGGLYIFRNGPLYVQAHGTLKGEEVAILFTGDDTTRLITQAGANIITSARSDVGATFRGLAFAQDPTSVPAKENIIIGGGQIEINGIMYFPEQPLKITGNGDIGSTAAQFAIMADTISIEGNGQLVHQYRAELCHDRPAGSAGGAGSRLSQRISRVDLRLDPISRSGLAPGSFVSPGPNSPGQR